MDVEIARRVTGSCTWSTTILRYGERSRACSIPPAYSSRRLRARRRFSSRSARDRPACLVLDVILPGAGGLELQSTLRKTGRLLPIVFITGHGEVSMSVQAMKHGAVDFLQKPVNGHQLLDCIQRGLGVSRQLRIDRSERLDIQQRHATLTPREREVMSLLLAGRINKQIAEELGNTEKTVKIQRRRVMEKMRVRSVAELVWLAGKVDLLD